MRIQLRVLVLLALVLTCPALRGSDQQALIRARGLIKSAHFQEAEKVLREALAEDTNSAPLHAELGGLFLGRNSYSDAVDELGRAAQLEPDNPQYTVRLAGALVAWGHYKVAVDLLDAVSGKFGSLPEYHYNLGMAYYGLKSFDTAQLEFEKTIALAPKLDSAYFLLGNCYATNGDFQRAASVLYKALSLSPARPDYHVALGKVLSQIPDQADKARGCYRKALALRPGYVLAEYCLAVDETRRGELERARAILEKITAQHPEALKAHIVLARVYARLGRREDAERETSVVKDLSAAQQRHVIPSADPLAGENP